MPLQPKLYHICHIDRLPSILVDGCLWCDAEMVRRSPTGTTIGMTGIKQRRLSELTLNNYPDLHVGDCVPFYFCSRSVMLYLIHRANHEELIYCGGQRPIIHLEADLHSVVTWANRHQQRWAFTLSNAGSYYFEDRRDLAQLHEIDWEAVQARVWGPCKEGKQAEFLLEQRFPVSLIERIGVYSRPVYQQVVNALAANEHKPLVEIRTDWYY